MSFALFIVLTHCFTKIGVLCLRVIKIYVKNSALIGVFCIFREPIGKVLSMGKNLPAKLFKMLLLRCRGNRDLPLLANSKPGRSHAKQTGEARELCLSAGLFYLAIAKLAR